RRTHTAPGCLEGAPDPPRRARPRHCCPRVRRRAPLRPKGDRNQGPRVRERLAIAADEARGGWTPTAARGARRTAQVYARATNVPIRGRTIAWETDRRNNRCCTFAGVPNGIRTRVLALKGPRPRPLDDGDPMA